MADEDTEGLLDGVRVLEMSHVMAAPSCGLLLADMGADVIKVEPPGGDPMRHIGPFAHDQPGPDSSLYWLHFATNRRSITLDVTSADGAALLRRLASTADVVLETYQPGLMESLGLGYGDLSDLNPGLVYVSITPFGQTGPYKDYKGSDLIGLAMGGYMYVTGWPHTPPTRLWGSQAYHTASNRAYIGALLALYHRLATGEGQHVDVAISEYLATILENALSMYSYTGSNFRRTGNRGYGRAAWGPYACKDGYVGVIAGPDHLWSSMAELMGIPELDDPKFGDRTGRAANADELDALMQPWLSRHGKREIFERAQGLGLAFAYVATPDDIVQWEHLHERGFFEEVEHPDAGTYMHPVGPFQSEAMAWDLSPAPRLGQHNRKVYGDLLGMSAQEIVRLREASVI